jgi:pectate lyase
VILTNNRACLVALLTALGCGDGRDVHLGAARELPRPPDGGTGDGATGGDGTNGDATPTCANPDLVPPLLELLEQSDEAGRGRVGFGQAATGGKGGCLYRVTDFSDDFSDTPRPGTLRFGLESAASLWITFDGPGVIELVDNIRPLSNKTIDGRGTDVSVRNYGLEIIGQQNFVIHNVEFVGDPDVDVPGDAGDAITLRQGTHTVWIDHCTFSSYTDGLIDVIDGATDVTISWSHFRNQDKVMLLGSENDPDAGPGMRVTLHHNWFDHTNSYHPRARWGMVHTFNNLLDAWRYYGAGPTQDVRLYSEANIYLADPEISTEAIKTDIEDEAPGKVWSEQDAFLGKATPYVNLDPTPAGVFLPSESYVYRALPADDSLLNDVRSLAGSR